MNEVSASDLSEDNNIEQRTFGQNQKLRFSDQEVMHPRGTSPGRRSPD